MLIYIVTLIYNLVMHIFFSGIGGTAIGPLALIAKQAGYEVSGSDKQESQYTNYLKEKGINLYIGQEENKIQKLHRTTPIDWYVYSSALPLENPNHPELSFIKKHNINHSKRDKFLSSFIKDRGLSLLAFAGTHGKTSSTAMAVWVFKQLGIDVSYSVGAKISFGEMGNYSNNSNLFVYECDEFDNNFLSYNPYYSVLTKVDWDHHEQFITREKYKNAFKQFCNQSDFIVAHAKEIDYLSLKGSGIIMVDTDLVKSINLAGQHNRENGAAVATAINNITGIGLKEIVEKINLFPGSNRRFEPIAKNIYTDYAHTPEEIEATLQMAKELSDEIVAVYEPLTNRRQHYFIKAYKDVFKDINSLYWLPSYLAREDPKLPIIRPQQFIDSLNKNINAQAAKLDDGLKTALLNEANDGKLVLLFAGGGGGSLDEWARQNLVS